ncbi:MAG: hypothetical protein M1454_00965 [Candidatus Thermoplasmatota archaeon]|nr:hypothetical protein [Candidatus Thermoplasmatota archaeon]MCL5731273.1 hypothetical protein [Candidatus Thermoplasmatota archaeon]
MSRIGIFTGDFRFYHEVIAIAKEWGLPFLSIDPMETIPTDVPVIVSTSDDYKIDPSQIFIDDPYRALRTALPRLIDQISFKRIVIGIDPGPKPGIAIVCDDILTEALEIPELKLLEAYLVKVLSDYPYGSYSIRLGNGDKPNRLRISDMLKRNGLYFSVVDESNTTIFRHRPQNNAIAAAVIGLARHRIEVSYGKKHENFLDSRFVTIRNSI